MEQKEASDHKRRDLVIILIILLIGFLCVIVAGEQAARFAPRWKMDTSMGSNIDPNSDFLTSRPVNFIEPLDASILTQPAWINVFLTPGASYETSTPVPTNTIVNTLPPITQTRTPVATLIATNTLPVIASPTKTPIYYPPSTPTSTSVPGASADLRITMSDGSSTYVVGGTRTYTITVYNLNGPSNVNGATVVDNFPAELSGIAWTCSGTGGGICTANGAGNINTSVNLPVGSSVTFTVNANVSPAATGNLVNTATVVVPVGVTDPTPANNTVTDTNTPVFNVDLQITKTDGVTSYVPGTSVTYTIAVTNAGPANVTGATITDTFPVQVSSVTWSCVSAGSALCTANETGNINDIVSIPPGGSLMYTAVASIASSATGSLSNTATVTAPGGYTGTTTDSATDTDIQNSIADLSITITDNSTDYFANASKLLPNTPPYAYTITVYNAGPSVVSGATVSNVFSNGNATSIGWICTPSAGASCASFGPGNLDNVSVNLNSGSSVTFYLAVQVVSNPFGDLVNDVTVTAPIGITDAPGNNSATDSDTLIVPDPLPPEIGTTPSAPSGIYNLPEGNSLTLNITTQVNGDVGTPDLVYYEFLNGGFVFLDQVIIQIGDGSNWYTVFNWGDEARDTNTNVDYTLLPDPMFMPLPPPEEPDERDIPPTSLRNGAGVEIDLDLPFIPSGTYPFLRFIAPLENNDNKLEIDAIEVLP